MYPDGGNGLSRTSSLVLNSPTKSSTPGKKPSKIVTDFVPDSQEESGSRTRSLYNGDIIELTSESESESEETAGLSTGKKKDLVDNNSDPFLSSSKKVIRTSTKQSQTVIEESDTEEHSDEQPRYILKASKLRLTVLSDSEDETEKEMNAEAEDGTGIEANGAVDDGAILVLNDPPSSRKPAARNDVSPSKSRRKSPPAASLVLPTPSGGQVVVADPSPLQTPVLPRSKAAPRTQAKLPDFFVPKGKPRKKDEAKEAGKAGTSGAPSLTTAGPVTPVRHQPKTKRKTKRELEQEKHTHLAGYAQALFDELNESVFKGKLPKDTPLVWNKRLLATAGRAKWHRDSQGVVTTSIELATKVLDCEERIRNTLSHEMCHLACWVINCNPKENHGGVWRGWVDEVMEKRPDIEITTKHSYDITYKYEWQCQTTTCKKIYGRFSDSIDPANSICGVCKVGELIPLFKKRTRKTNTTSKMAADKPRESPLQSLFPPRSADATTPTRLSVRIKLDERVIIPVSDSSDADSDTGHPSDVMHEAELQEATQLDSSTVVDSGSGAGTEDVRKLVTHMSFIDLTGD